MYKVPWFHSTKRNQKLERKIKKSCSLPKPSWFLLYEFFCYNLCELAKWQLSILSRCRSKNTHYIILIFKNAFVILPSYQSEKIFRCKDTLRNTSHANSLTFINAQVQTLSLLLMYSLKSMPQNILNLIQKIHSLLQFITMDSSDTRVEEWLEWEE